MTNGIMCNNFYFFIIKFRKPFDSYQIAVEIGGINQFHFRYILIWIDAMN